MDKGIEEPYDNIDMDEGDWYEGDWTAWKPKRVNPWVVSAKAKLQRIKKNLKERKRKRLFARIAKLTAKVPNAVFVEAKWQRNAVSYTCPNCEGKFTVSWWNAVPSAPSGSTLLMDGECMERGVTAKPFERDGRTTTTIPGEVE